MLINTKAKNKQSGVALITAMIITTIAVSVATMIMYRQQIQIRLSSNISNLEQSYLYATGMEDWAATILEKSYKDHTTYDSYEDDWYSDNALVLPIEGGVMTGKLYDLQARININSLNIPPPVPQNGADQVKNDQNDPTKKGAGANGTNASSPGTNINKKKPDIAKINRARLIKLISNIDEDQDLEAPDSFVDILKDWVDRDDINGNIKDRGDGSGYGAETPYYQSLEPAYYSANTEMVSPTELRLLKGMKEKIYQKLKDQVSTLPIRRFNKTNEIPINVNTAEDEVFKAIGFTPDTINQIKEARKDNPFKTIKEFKTRFIPNADVNNGGINAENLGVKSDYFLLEGTVEINNARLFINSILERNNGQVSVIMRDLSNPNVITKVIK